MAFAGFGVQEDWKNITFNESSLLVDLKTAPKINSTILILHEGLTCKALCQLAREKYHLGFSCDPAIISVVGMDGYEVQFPTSGPAAASLPETYSIVISNAILEESRKVIKDYKNIVQVDELPTMLEALAILIATNPKMQELPGSSKMTYIICQEKASTFGQMLIGITKGRWGPEIHLSSDFCRNEGESQGRLFKKSLKNHRKIDV